ncbi:hypothetical protein [Solimonas soli]|uniref:hypothetical protein n=1 Tax=Solimonas soli TaxID=413479 RepID=UPI0012FA5A1A|nr:hypothetical protein [Solimonas soli]
MENTVDQLLSIASAISRGEIPPYQHNECFTSGAFDLLVINAHGAKAFDLLQQVCARYGEIKSSGIPLSGYFKLLEILARQSNTTEQPQGIQAIISEQPELSRELRSWYRAAG